MFAQGFRPFFSLAALLAACAVPAWLWLLHTGPLPGMALTPRDWHVHEMIFGYGSAVLGGFLLTAIPNWTKRPAIAGLPLVLLVVCWLLGRIALLLLGAMPMITVLVASTFLLSLCALVWHEVLAAGNRRNLPVCALLTLFSLANVLFLLGALQDAGPAGLRAYGERGGIATLLLFICLIGGRVVPAFSRNWMQAKGITKLPAAFGNIDRVALITAIVALAAFVLIPDKALTGWLFAVAALSHGLRLYRWRGWQACREPLVLVLHVAYAWLVAGFGLLALSILDAGVSPSSAVHSLTTGAIGTMTLAIMTRATLGHCDRPLRADKATVFLYALVLAGALLRVAAPWLTSHYLLALDLAAAMWSGAFAVFLAAYGPMLLGALRQAQTTAR